MKESSARLEAMKKEMEEQVVVMEVLKKRSEEVEAMKDEEVERVKRSVSALEKEKEAVVSEMRLQLYKVQEHAYLLDFQKLDGNVCSFMHLCAMIIDQLQKGLSKNAQLGRSGGVR